VGKTHYLPKYPEKDTIFLKKAFKNFGRARGQGPPVAHTDAHAKN